MFTKNSGTTKRRMMAFLYAAVLVLATTSAHAQNWTWPEPGNKHSGPGAGLQPYGGGEFNPQRSNPSVWHPEANTPKWIGWAQ